MATAVGLGIARAVHVALAAAGLATLLRTEPWAFEVVRMIGAIYLIWLGIKIARAPSLTPQLETPPTPGSPKAHHAAIWQGILTNVTNPKALLFCSVLLPQFVHAEAGNVAGQFLFLGVVLVALGFLFDTGFAFAGAALGWWMKQRPVIQSIQQWTFAMLLIGFGVRLAMGARLH